MENDDSALLSELEADFKTVVNELLSDATLERVRQEYERLYKLLTKSHKNEQLLVKKCKQLKAELIGNADTVLKAVRNSEEDQNTIQLLKAQIQKAWKRLDSAVEKENKAQKRISELLSEIKSLQTVVHGGCGLTEGQEDTVNELLKVKEHLTKELEEQNKQLKLTTKECNLLTDELKQLKQNYSKSDDKIENLKARLQNMKEQSELQTRRAERSEKQLKIMNEAIAEKNKELKDQQTLVSTLRSDRAEMFSKLSKVKEEVETKRLELERKDDDMKDLMSEKDCETQKKNEIFAEKHMLELEQESKMEEIKRIKEDRESKKREIGRLKEEQKQLRVEKGQIQAAMEEMRNHFESVRTELKTFAKKTETDSRTAEDLRAELHRLATQLNRAKKLHERNEGNLTESKLKSKELFVESQNYSSLVRDLKRETETLRKQRLRDAHEMNSLNRKNDDLKKVLVTSGNQLERVEGEIQEKRGQFKQQQSLYEQVRSERNHFCQQHIEAREEIAELQKEMKMHLHQITHSKEEMQTKDKAILKQHMKIKHLSDERLSLQKKINKKKEILAQYGKLLAAQEVELGTLRTTLCGAQEQQRKQKQVFDTVADERDILSAQCIRRNDELALLNEKIRILESTLQKGEVVYRERKEDVKVLKIKVKDLDRQLDIRNADVQNMKSLKLEVFKLQRELLHEQTKVKALTEEIQNPINVHRWRKLEGSDPESYELIQKIQTLQKRLIEKTEEVVSKDLIIEEKERLYVELKNILARQPGPEVAEQLTAYQQTLKERTRQMKAIAAELNMCQAQVNEYKYEIDRLTRENNDTKRKYYEQR